MSALENIVVTPSRRPLKFQVTDVSIQFLCFDNAISREERMVFFMSLFALKPLLIDRSILPTYKDTTYAPDHYVEVRVIDNVQHPAYGQAGLFARRAIPTNTIITSYSGFIEALHTAVNSRTYTMGYGNNDVDGLALDAEFIGNFGRFANDPRGVEGASANIAAESRHTTRGEVYTALVTRRPIAAGEEILMSYGKEHHLTEAPWMNADGVPLMRPRIMAAAPFPLLAPPPPPPPPRAETITEVAAAVAHQLVWQCVQCGFWSLTTCVATVGAAAVERCSGCGAPRLAQSRLVSVLASPPLTDAKLEVYTESNLSPIGDTVFLGEKDGSCGHPDTSGAASSLSSSSASASSDEEEETTSKEWWEAERRPIRARLEAERCDTPVCLPTPNGEFVASPPPRKRGRPPKVKEDVGAVPPKRQPRNKKGQPQEASATGESATKPKRSPKKKVRTTESHKQAQDEEEKMQLTERSVTTPLLSDTVPPQTVVKAEAREEKRTQKRVLPLGRLREKAAPVVKNETKVAVKQEFVPVVRVQPEGARRSERNAEKRKTDKGIRRAVLQKIEQLPSSPSSPCRHGSPTSPRSSSNLGPQGVAVSWPMSLPFLCWQVWDPTLPLQVATSHYSTFALGRHTFLYHVSTRVKEKKNTTTPLLKTAAADGEKDFAREAPESAPKLADTMVKQEEEEEEEDVANHLPTVAVEEEQKEEEQVVEGAPTVPLRGRRLRLRLKVDNMWTPNANHTSERETTVPEVKREEAAVEEDVEEEVNVSNGNTGGGGDRVTDSPEGHFVQRLYHSYQEHNPLLKALAPEFSTNFLDRFVLLPTTGTMQLDMARAIQEVVLHTYQRVYTAKSFKAGELVQYVGGIIRRRQDARDRPSYSPLSIPLHYMIPRAQRRHHRVDSHAPETKEEKVNGSQLMGDFVHRCSELELIVTNEFMYCPCFAVQEEGRQDDAEEVNALLRRTCNVTLLLSIDAQGSPFVAAVATRAIAAYEPLLACTQ